MCLLILIAEASPKGYIAGMNAEQDKLRVLHCLSRSQIGGAQRRVVWIAEPLRRHGIDSIVLFPKDGDREYADWLESMGLPYHRLPFAYLRGLRRIWNNARFGLTMPRVVRRIQRLLREERIDLLHVNGVTNLQPVLAGLRSGVPLVWNLNDLLAPRAYVRLVRPLMERPGVRIAVATEAIIDNYHLHDLPGWQYLPEISSPTPPRTGRNELRAALGIPVDAPVLGCVSNLVPLKGCVDFVAVAERLLAQNPRLHAVLVGGEAESQAGYAARVRAMVAASPHASRIHLPGFQNDVPAWLRTFDALLYPSHTEACPILVLEAMEAGLPMVLTAVGEIPRMVDGIDVPLVRPMDLDAMEQGARSMLALDEATRISLARDLRKQVAQHYSLEAMIERHLAMYRQLTEPV